MKIIVLGGRGFVGESVCNELRKRKHTVYTFDRHDGGKFHRRGSITSFPDLDEALKKKDVVINLVGLTPIREPKGTTYKDIHVNALKNILRACKNNDVKRLVHMSALGADEDSDIDFLRTKGIGEKLVLGSGLKVNVMCPSVIYDEENELVLMCRRFAVFRLFPEIRAKVQPIYRKDLSVIFRKAAEGKVKEKRLEIGGPEKMTFFEMAEKIYNAMGYSCYPVPIELVKLGMNAASVFGLFGLGKDQIRYLDKNNATDSGRAAKYVKMKKFSEWVKNEL